MILISHRGNINGPTPDRENSPDFILEALAQGVDVEIDVWLTDHKWYLGHDEAQYEIPFNFLQMPGLWCHCKNLAALRTLIDYPEIISVWIDSDLYPLTSNGYIWTHTEVSKPKYLTDKSIAIMPDVHEDWDKTYDLCAGVCSDHIGDYK